MRSDPHVRYAALVARQLAAIQAEDLDEYARLAAERDDAAADLQRLPPEPDEQARLALAEAVELDTRIISILRQRRDLLRARIRAEDNGRANALAYARAATPAAAAAASFDVSL